MESQGMVSGLSRCLSKRVKLIQVVGQVQVVDGVGGFRSPFQTPPESRENWFSSLSEYSCLAFLTSLLNLYFAYLSLSLFLLLNASSFTNC